MINMLMKPVYVDLQNKNLKVTLCSLGASIYRIRYYDEDMVLTPKKKEKFELDNAYYGKTIGRVCGRMLAEPFGNYNPEDNERGVSLHGGINGLSAKEFDVSCGANFVEFHYLSKDGEAGYPGNLILRVRYELINDELLLTYHAVVDKPCLVALTNHAYFCLGEAEKNNLVLKFDADQYITADERLIIHDLAPVPEKWVFKDGLQLSKPGNIDNFFLLNKKVIELSSKRFSMRIDSDFEGTQLFTDHFMNDVEMYNSPSFVSRGIAIEPQDNQLDRKELLPKQIYERYIKYTFKKL